MSFGLFKMWGMNEKLEEKGLVACEDGRIRPAWAAESELMRNYYDHEWGRPIVTESEAFERLVLEGFQAGLSWAIVLRKRDAFRLAFKDFDVDAVAAFSESDIERCAENPDIIRNRAKIRAAVHNARRVQELRDDGGLLALLASFAPEHWEQPVSSATARTVSAESHQMAAMLMKKGFKFVGPTTCFALMEETGLINNRVVGASDLL